MPLKKRTGSFSCAACQHAACQLLDWKDRSCKNMQKLRGTPSSEHVGIKKTEWFHVAYVPAPHHGDRNWDSGSVVIMGIVSALMPGKSLPGSSASLKPKVQDGQVSGLAEGGINGTYGQIGVYVGSMSSHWGSSILV